MKITKEIFVRVFELSDLKYECGVTFFIESENKIYSFCFGADGSIWDKTFGTAKSQPNEIEDSRNNVCGTYLGIYELKQP